MTYKNLILGYLLLSDRFPVQQQREIPALTVFLLGLRQTQILGAEIIRGDHTCLALLLIV